MMAGQDFVRKMSEEIKRVVGRIVAGELKDPRVGMACVVAVDLSPDLGHAKVFVRVLGDESQRWEAMEALQHATGHIKRELGKRTRFKYVPEIVFELDRTTEKAERIEELLRNIHEEEHDVEDPREECP